MLQFVVNMVEWDMNVQQAAAGRGHIPGYRKQRFFGAHQAEAGRVEVTPMVAPFTIAGLERMGYDVGVVERPCKPTTAIRFDHELGTMHRAASDYGIAR